VIEAFAEPDNAGKGVIKLGSRVIERLHERQAKRTLELAAAIAAMAEEQAEAE
jgi:citrate lyase subunit beta/citryl-CoA lyase